MRTIILAASLASMLAAGIAAMGGAFCFHTGEKVDGLNKICFYSCPSGEAAITIKSTAICPVSINR
jgi:hypothetical protein